MQLTPPDVPQAFATPTYNYSWKVQSTNNLAVLAYSAEQYQQL